MSNITHRSNMSALRIESLNVGTRLLPLSFHCEKGAIVHLIGANGSGKSTLLSALAATQWMTSSVTGQVWLQDESVGELSLAQLALKRAYLCQTARPSFNVEVFHYLSLSIPSCAEADAHHVKAAIDKIVTLLHIKDKLHRHINTLSGGEWQRVRLAAVCIQIWPTINPYGQLLLLDEPSSALDIGHEGMLYRLIDVIAEQGITVVMANHDLNRTLKHAQQVILLDKGIMVAQGRTLDVMQGEVLSKAFATSIRNVWLEQKPYLVFD